MDSVLIHQKEIQENIYKSFKTTEILIGGDADNMTIEDIAHYWCRKSKSKYELELSNLKKQFLVGVEEEKEHSDSKKLRTEIVLDHLRKDKSYYTKLSKIED